MTYRLIRTDKRYGGRPRAFALLVADSLPVQLGLDEAGIEVVEGLAGAHGQRGRDPGSLPGDRAAGHVAGGRVSDPVPADRTSCPVRLQTASILRVSRIPMVIPKLRSRAARQPGV